MTDPLQSLLAYAAEIQQAQEYGTGPEKWLAQIGECDAAVELNDIWADIKQHLTFPEVPHVD